MKLLSKNKINLLRQNARSVVRELGLLNDAYHNVGVTLAERHLLIELSTHLYPTVGGIAERLLLDKSTASRLIAKGVKKGYVKYASDDADKRKRFLQLTDLGKKTLNAFEPIAFNQTKEALLNLSEEDVETVYKGISLYAKGLKISRLRSKLSISKISISDSVEIMRLISDGQKEAESFNLYAIYGQKKYSYLVMKLDSEIIGGIGMSPDSIGNNNQCQFKNTYFCSEWKEISFEEILLDGAIKEAKKLGYHKCLIDTAKENFLSLERYLEIGFQIFNKNKKAMALVWKAC